MIRSLSLKFGRAPGEAPETISATPVTVFVGPNNSGKSKVLREIHHYCSSGRRDANACLLAGIEFDTSSLEQAEERLRQAGLRPRSGEALAPNHVIVGKRGARRPLVL